MNGLGEAYVKKRVRATDYLTVAQLFLQDNFLLERELSFDDVKPRLLGHWGTCHGINLAYANLKSFFQEIEKDFSFVVGPGHGFPALQANLFLDGDLRKIAEDVPDDDIYASLKSSPKEALAFLCREFSWPSGFPSHASPLTPKVICEGGELGYALGAAYGAALGHPEKTIAVLIGDGELETATALSSMNLVKLFATKENGAVLPILHLNGYKISGPTISGRKSERELLEQIRGFGYYPILIDGSFNSFQKAFRIFEIYQIDQNLPYNPYTKKEDVYAKLENSFGISRTAFANKPPFIIMKTEKGEGCPEYVKGQKVSGNFKAHQIPLLEAKTDQEELEILENWLKSYHFEELFDAEKGFML